jgi:hypothetical protein
MCRGTELLRETGSGTGGVFMVRTKLQEILHFRQIH